MASMFAKLVTYKKNKNPFAFEWAIYRKSDKILQEFLSEDIPSNSRILDVGCGSASYWNLRSDLNWVGVDINPESKATFVIESNKAYPFENEVFDAIILSFSIEHIANLDLLIKELTRVLKQGGIVVIRCPFLYPLHDTPDDYWRFSLEGLAILFSNFKMVKFNYAGNYFLGAAVYRNYYLLQTFERVFSQGFWRAFFFLPFILTIFVGNLISLFLSNLDKTEKFPVFLSASYKKQ